MAKTPPTAGLHRPPDGYTLAGRELAGRAAVVTGSSSGIGRAIALELAAAGADVIIHGRANLAGAQRTAAEATDRYGVAAHVIMADLANPAACDEFVTQTFAAAPHTDIWVNNAGVDTLTGEAAGWSFEAKLAALLAVDVTATIRLSRTVGRRLALGQTGNDTRRTPSDGSSVGAKPTGDSGVILTVGWDQAETGFAGDSGELFAASKGAVMSFTRSLALSLAPAVRVNCLAPGWIRTAWGENASENWQRRAVQDAPLRRWGLPADLASAARFLCGPGAGFITGQTIRVNGGAVR